MRVAVLHDVVRADDGPDSQDTLEQVAVVERALRDLGHDSMVLACSLDLDAITRAIDRLKPELVFNLVESLEGHGRLIHLVPSLLDALRHPYTGAPSEAMFLTSSKLLAKERLAAAGIATPSWMTDHSFRLDRMEHEAGQSSSTRDAPWILKPVWEHASVGLDAAAVLRAGTPKELRAALRERSSRLGLELFAERFIEGREMNVGLLDGPMGPQVLPPAEILFCDFPEAEPKIVGYRAKWVEDSFEWSHTPRSFEFTEEDDGLLSELADIARRAWDLFGLRGYARVDFRIDEEGRPWVLEVNANPCLAEDAGFQAALARARTPFTEAVRRIVKSALRRVPS